MEWNVDQPLNSFINPSIHRSNPTHPTQPRKCRRGEVRLLSGSERTVVATLPGASAAAAARSDDEEDEEEEEEAIIRLDAPTGALGRKPRPMTQLQRGTCTSDLTRHHHDKDKIARWAASTTTQTHRIHPPHRRRPAGERAAGDGAA